jgi:hypothetical protein
LTLTLRQSLPVFVKRFLMNERDQQLFKAREFLSIRRYLAGTELRGPSKKSQYCLRQQMGSMVLLT